MIRTVLQDPKKLMLLSVLLFGLCSRAMLVSGRVNVAKHVGVECDSSIGQYDGIHIRPKSGRKPKLHSAKFVKPSRIRIEILDMPLFWGGLETYHIKINSVLTIDWFTTTLEKNAIHSCHPLKLLLGNACQVLPTSCWQKNGFWIYCLLVFSGTCSQVGPLRSGCRYTYLI